MSAIAVKDMIGIISKVNYTYPPKKKFSHEEVHVRDSIILVMHVILLYLHLTFQYKNES